MGTRRGSGIEATGLLQLDVAVGRARGQEVCGDLEGQGPCRSSVLRPGLVGSLCERCRGCQEDFLGIRAPLPGAKLVGVGGRGDENCVALGKAREGVREVGVHAGGRDLGCQDDEGGVAHGLFDGGGSLGPVGDVQARGNVREDRKSVV